jgi:HlyD family secretion protein
VDAALAVQKEAEATLADTVIHAPLSGTVVTKVTDPGEYVIPGTPIVILVDLRNLHMKTYVKETDIGKVKLGDPGRVFLDAFPNRPFTARVSEISPDAEFTPKSVDIKEERVKLVFGVKLAVENPESYLKPGIPVDGEILWKPENSSSDHLVQQDKENQE